jgi:hypothetical protein
VCIRGANPFGAKTPNSKAVVKLITRWENAHLIVVHVHRHVLCSSEYAAASARIHLFFYDNSVSAATHSIDPNDSWSQSVQSGEWHEHSVSANLLPHPHAPLPTNIDWSGSADSGTGSQHEAKESDHELVLFLSVPPSQLPDESECECERCQTREYKDGWDEAEERVNPFLSLTPMSEPAGELEAELD